MVGSRQRFAVAAAAVSGTGLLVTLWGLVRTDDAGDRGVDRLGVVDGSLVLVLLVLVVVAFALLLAYALTPLPNGVAVTAIVLLALGGMVGGSAMLYLPYVAALLAGLALAAGEPLPPPDPGDDRMSRPMPRGDG